MKSIAIVCLLTIFMFCPQRKTEAGQGEKMPPVIVSINKYELIKYEISVQEFFRKVGQVNDKLDSIAKKIKSK